MKKLILLVILAFSMVLSPLATTFAATPKVINYQGQLESDAITSKAPVLVVFELFEDAAGGSALWIEQKSVTVDKNGFFSVYLGDVNPIDLKFDKQYYVQVTVGNNQPFPRTKLSSTPSAFYAADADTATYAFTAGLAMDVAPKAIGLDNLADEVLTAGGDLMGMYPNPQIKPSAIIDNIPDGSITSEMLSPNISTSPSGPAGGDLFGSYPDPLIAVGAVKTDRIFDGAVTNQKIADGAVTNNKIVSLDAAKLTNVPALNYQVAVATDATIDGDGTLAMPLGLADDAVSTSKIVDGAVTNAKVGADAITSDKIMNETILAEDIAAGAVTTSEILNETILAEDIATGAVTTSEILNETILAEDIATGAVTTSEILNSTILTEDLADLSVTNAKLADDAVRVRNIDVIGAGPANGDVLYFDGGTNEMRWGQENVETSAPLTGNGTTLAPVTLDPTFGSADELLIRTAPSGWVSSKINTNNIADGAVTSAKILDGDVQTIDLANLSVTNAKLADNSVTTAKILDGQVMTDDLATNAVTTVKITDANVTTAKLADASVTTAKINDDAVTNIKIDDDAVTGNKVLDGSLSSLDLNTTGVVAGIYGDPSASPSVIDVPEFKVDAQGRILTAVENSYTVLAAGTIFNESPVSDITVDGTYDNLDLQIKPGVVGNTELAADAVTTDKILDGEVMTADLMDLGVTTAKIADMNVTTGKIADAGVTTIKIADGNVTSAKILDGDVQTADLMDLGVTTAKIADMNVTTGKIADAGVTTIKIADGNVTSAKILDGDVQTADLADGSVTSAKIADLGIATIDYADNSVINTKIGSGAQVAGKVLKADGAGNTVWGDDLGLTLPYTGAYPGPGDAFKLTHTGAAGNGSVAIFTSSTSANTSDGVVINKGVDNGAGSALSVSGTGVQGTNYIAKFTNTNLAEGRTVLIENNAPVLAAQITDPNAIPNDGDEFVTPDPTGTDLNDATLVVRNSNAAPSNEKLAIKTYGSIQANSTIQGTNLVAYGGQVTLLNPTNGAVAAIVPPTTPGYPLNVTPGLNINLTSAVPATGLNNIWDSTDGVLVPAGTGTNADVPTALAVSNSIGVVSAEPFITFQADGGSLTNNRVFAVNSTLTKTVAGADNGNVDLSINLANPNTWTGTQTLSAAGNGLVVTTNSDLQGNIANSIGDVTVNDNLVVSGTSTLKNATTIGSNALAGAVLIADNSDAGTPTAVITNNGGGSSINATGNVTINSGGLNVTGATDLNTGLNVDGASTLDAVTIAGTLSQSGGQVTLAGNVDATAGLDVTGATTLAGTVTQTGGGQITLSGNVDANNGLDVIGAATVAGTVSQTGAGNQVTFAGNVDANNGLDVTGNFTLAVAPVVPVNQIVTTVSGASTNSQLPTAASTWNAIAAVADAQFLTLAFDPDLTNERKATFSGNFATVDNGANANYDIDLSNTGVGAASYGNNTGTSYSTFTVDAKGRLTAAGTQAIVVNDNGLATNDINITGASSDALDLQINANAVTPTELATADYSGDLAVGNYNLGNLDGTIIGGSTPAAGTFTNLRAQTDLTIDATSTAANTTVDDIYTSVDFGVGPLITGNDTDLITAGAVAAALAATDLQIAYNNGSNIVTAGGDAIDFTLTNGGFNVNGPGAVALGAPTSVTGANTFTVGTGATTLGGTLTSAGLVTANAGATVAGANLTVGTTTVDPATGNTNVGGTLNVTGATTAAAVTASGLVTANAGATVAGANLTVALDAAVTGNVTAANVTAATAVTATAGDITATAGNIAATAGSVTAGTTVNAGTNVTAGGNVIATGDVSGVNGTFTGTVTGVAGTFSGLISANGGLTMGAAQNFTMGGNPVNDIYTSADPTNPIAGTDAQLITALAVQNALQAHDLQAAYDNGQTINTTSGNLVVNGPANVAINTATGITGATTLTGTLGQSGGQVTFAGNVDATNGLDVTGATTLTGAVTQAGGQVTFGGNVDANNGLDVAGGANIAGGVNVSSGGVAVAAGGVTVTAGGVTVSAGANNFGPGVSTFNGNVIANTVDIAGGAGSEIDNTVIGGNVAANGTFTNLTANTSFTSTGLITANGGLTVNGVTTLNGNTSVTGANTFTTGTGQVTFGGNVDANNGLDVTGNLVVTGTTDLQGTVANSTGAVTVNDDVVVTLFGAEQVNVNGAGSTATPLTVSSTSNVNTINASGTGTAATLSAANTSAGSAASFTSAAAGSANATVVLNNIEGTSNAYAVSVSDGHVQYAADAVAVLANNGTITVGSKSVIRFTTGGFNANTITLTAGSQIGQIIIVTNEDAGTITITAGALGTPAIAGQTAAQFVWNGGSWVIMN